MKKNGFTLIELLEVFLVLGVILAIAVPKISNVRDDSLKRSFMISVENIMKEIKNQNQDLLASLNESTVTYTFTNGKVSPDLKLSGELPNSGTMEINSNGKIKVNVSNDKYCAVKEYNESDITVKDIDAC